MTPGARIQSAVELLEAVDAAEPPIEPTVERFLRGRRYMGAKDRRSVVDRVYRILRRRHRLDWWLARSGTGTPTARLRVIADAALHPDEREAEPEVLFSGAGHAAAPLSADEAALFAAASGPSFETAGMPDPVRLEFPDWLEGPLRRAFGANLEREMRALNEPAPVDLRVNAALATREAAQASLKADGIEATPTPMSPVGLRVAGRANLKASVAFRRGLVEVQDEGSQIVALLAGAAPGRTVIDFCAGAGGKTLALAAAMSRDGHLDGTLWACDVAARFMEKLVSRAARARAQGIRRHVLEGESDEWPAAMAGSADVVLIDAPCSGTGIWRRHPAAKWWLTPDRLAEMTARQGEILGAASRLVVPGGRLVYATCSVLAEENEDVADSFPTAHADFAAVPAAEAWAGTLGGPCPASGPYLRMSPAATGTDGFFAAVFERAGGR